MQAVEEGKREEEGGQHKRLCGVSWRGAGERKGKVAVRRKEIVQAVGEEAGQVLQAKKGNYASQVSGGRRNGNNGGEDGVEDDVGPCCPCCVRTLTDAGASFAVKHMPSRILVRRKLLRTPCL